MGLPLIAYSLSEFGAQVSGVLMAAAGLGLIIFVHELGHFAVARLCGVKCDKFMIGFDVWGLKLSRKWGETEYGVGAFPLGGYVKMLGQDDDPSKAAEQFEQTRVEQGSQHAKLVKAPDGTEKYIDRRSYQAKSVPQRMAIISAGVVMNVIFAFVFAFFAYGMGVEYLVCGVSHTTPGDPAWRAGLQTGDEILQIGDRKDPSFDHLSVDVTLADEGAGVDFLVRRAGSGDIEPITLTPIKRDGSAKIGVLPPCEPRINSKAKPRELQELTEKRNLPDFQPGDRIESVGGAPVADYRDLTAALAAAAHGEPLEVVVSRDRTPDDEGVGQGSSPGGAEVAAQRLTLKLPAVPAKGLGLVMSAGPVTGVQTGSPAERAGLAVGDTLLAVNGVPFRAGQALPAGEPLQLLVRRAAAPPAGGQSPAGDEQAKSNPPVEVEVEALPPEPMFPLLNRQSPGVLAALGVVYRVRPVVASVRPDSPAAADIQPGDRVESVTLLTKNKKGELVEGKPWTLPPADPAQAPSSWSWFGGTPEPWSWTAIRSKIERVQQGSKVRVTLDRDGETRVVTLAPTDVPGGYRIDRNLFALLEHQTRQRQVESIGERAALAADRTWFSLTMVVRVLKKLVTREVDADNLGGPLMILGSSYQIASADTAQFLLFLTLISANLAVLNFLPIPVLDGGHMVFLAWEGVTGRPPNERLMIALQMVGVTMLLALMLFVTYNDVMRFFGS